MKLLPCLLLMCACLLAPFGTVSATDPEPPPVAVQPGESSAAASDLKCAPNPNAAWLSMVVMAFVYVVAIFKVSRLAAESGWKLGEALSEEYSSEPGSGERMVASSSRFIAFIGSITLVGLLTASSFYIVWALYMCQPLDRLNQLATYLISCMALFAPYALNKIGGMFKGK